MKEEITRQCLKVFLQHGIRKMTVKELVAPLGISTKTVYKYFDGKEALLDACLNMHYTQLVDGLVLLMEEHKNPVVVLFKIWIDAVKLDFGTTHAFYEDLNYYYPALQDKLIKKNSKKLVQPITAVFESGKQQGYFRKELNSAVVMEGMGAVYTLLTRTRQFEKFRLDAWHLAENTIGVYLRGLCTEKGLREIALHSHLTSFIPK